QTIFVHHKAQQHLCHIRRRLLHFTPRLVRSIHHHSGYSSLYQLVTAAPSAHAGKTDNCFPLRRVLARGRVGGLRASRSSAGWLASGQVREKGLDAALLCGIGPRFQGWKEMNAHAVVVARYGALVYEHYYVGEDQMWGRAIGRVKYDAEKRHDVR